MNKVKVVFKGMHPILFESGCFQGRVSPGDIVESFEDEYENDLKYQSYQKGTEFFNMWELAEKKETVVESVSEKTETIIDPKIKKLEHVAREAKHLAKDLKNLESEGE